MNLSDPESLYIAAQRMLDQGQVGAAEMMLRQATELADEDSPLYAAGLAVLMSIQGRPEESLELLGDRMEHLPEDATLMVAYGITMEASGDEEAAEDAFREALESNPENPAAQHGLALRLRQRGKLEEAERLACQAFRAVPEHPLYAMTACEMLESRGKRDLAFEVAEVGALYNPDEPDLVKRAVEGALAREMPERAWEVLSESDDASPWVAGWKATLLDMDGRYEEADELIAHTRSKGADDTTYLFLLACIYLRREDFETTNQLVTQILDLDPEHAGAFKIQAEISMEELGLEEAIDPLSKAYEGTQDAETGWELVSTYYSTSHYLDALNLSKRLKDDPEMPSTLYPTYAMLCHAALDEKDAAFAFLDEIPIEMAMAALEEMAKHGSQSPAEQALAATLKKQIAAAEAGPPPDPLAIASSHYAEKRYQECLEFAEGIVEEDNPDRMAAAEMFVLLAAAALGQAELVEELSEALHPELVEVALARLDDSGAGNDLEAALREVLEERLPEPVAAEASEEAEEADETDETDETDESEEPEEDLESDQEKSESPEDELEQRAAPLPKPTPARQPAAKLEINPAVLMPPGQSIMGTPAQPTEFEETVVSGGLEVIDDDEYEIIEIDDDDEYEYIELEEGEVIDEDDPDIEYVWVEEEEDEEDLEPVEVRDDGWDGSGF